MDGITPRVTAQYLENFQHQTVRMVGKVTQLRGEQATIDSSGSVSLVLNRVCTPIIFPDLVTGNRRIAAFLPFRVIAILLLM
jgi:hypothetical protein